MCRLLLALACVALVAGCDDPVPAPLTVATVAGEPVLASELLEEMERVRSEASASDRLDAQSGVELARGVLEGLIERRLLLAEARRTQVEVTEADIDAALARRGDSAPVSGVTTLSPEALRTRTREQLLVDRLLVRELVGRVALGTDEAREWYDANREALQRGAQVRALQIVTARREEAEALLRDIYRGVDFRKLAREHSVAPDGKDGGDLGWFGRGRMPPEVEKACFALRKGQVSDIVQSPWGFHLFKVIDRREEGIPAFAEVEAGIELKLRREAIAKAQAAFLARLREAADVKVHEEVLASVVVERRP